MLAVAVAMVSAAPRPDDKDTPAAAAAEAAVIPAVVEEAAAATVEGAETPAVTGGKQNPLIDAFNNFISPITNAFSNAAPGSADSAAAPAAANPAQGILDALNPQMVYNNVANFFSTLPNPFVQGTTQATKTGDASTAATPVVAEVPAVVAEAPVSA